MGLRASILNDDEVVRRLSTMFIPVAVHLYEIRKDPGPGGDLFRSVQRQMDHYQGIWIVSPEGKALYTDPASADWKPGDLVKAMDEVLKPFGPLKPRAVKESDPLPYRGRGVKPDGSVSLAAYGRLTHHGKADGPAVLDTVELATSEWATFAPPEQKGGAGWALPDGVARKLGCVISPFDDSARFFDEDYLQAEVKAKVESVEGTRARIRLTAAWKAKGVYGHEKGAPVHEASSTAEGTAVYDLEKKSMRSLILVLSGLWGGRETGGVIEWTSDPSPTKKDAGTTPSTPDPRPNQR